MRKLFSLVAVVALGTSIANALPWASQGYVQAAHGWVTNAEGKKVSIQGMVFPYRVERIEARNLSQPDLFSGKRFERGNTLSRDAGAERRSGRSGPESDVTFYSADALTGYGYIELNPSSLDDVTISSSGLNKPWQTLTFGFNYGHENFSNFLIRWRIYKTRVDNPAPQTDFTDEIADFGVIWNQSVAQGTYKVEISIAQAGVVTDDTTLFIAQQFRDAGNLQGEGAFEYGIDTVFNAGAAPAIGSSENQFWYDWDPVADGNYEDTEIDMLDSGLANHLWVMKTSSTGSSTQVFPVQVTTTFGFQTAGNVFSLWFPFDNDQVRVDPNYAGSRDDPNMRVVVEGLAPSSNITSLRLQTMTSAGEPDVQQKLFLWNFVGQAWVLVDTRFISTIPVLTDVTYGGTIPLANFVNASNRVRMKIETLRTTTIADGPWDLRLDQVNWYVTRP